MNQSGSNIPPEEKEKYNLDREQEADALLQHTKVERVIDMGKGDDGNTTYYVKCMCPAFTSRVLSAKCLQGEVSLTKVAPGKMRS